MGRGEEEEEEEEEHLQKTITRNCTQYSLAWVFLPFVHVVKF